MSILRFLNAPYGRLLPGIVAALVLLTGGPALAAQLTDEQARELQQAQQEFQEGAYDETIERLEQLLEDSPTIAEAHRLLGFAYYEAGDAAAARSSLIAALSHGRVTTDQLGRLVQIDRDAGRTAAALGALRLLILLEPEDASWRRLYAHTLVTAGASDEAAGVLEELIEADPTDVDARLRLANIYIDRAEPGRAASMLETAYHLGEQTPELAQNLAALWFDEDNLAAALAWHERAMGLEAEPTAASRLRWAELLLATGEVESAAEVAGGLAEHAEQDVRRDAHLLLGEAAIERADEDAAAAHWERAVEAGLTEPRVLMFLGAHHFNAGRHEQAAEHLAAYAELEPLDREGSRYLVLSYLASEQTDAAQSALHTHLERFELDEQSRQLIGEWTRSGG